MLAKATIFLLFTVSLLGFYPQRIVSEEVKISEQSIIMQIDYFADLYGVDSNLVQKIVQCESKGNKNAKGDFNKANGIAQFWEETFNRMSKILGEKLDYNSSYDQIKLLSFAMSKPDLAREWTSYRAIKNGGSYTFYSKQYKKTLTVYCKL